MPDTNPEEPRPPLGDKIRDIVNRALADTRRDKLQLDMLDEAFGKAAIVMPKWFEKKFNELNSHVKSRSKDAPEKEALIVITALTSAGGENEGSEKISYTPVGQMKLPISTAFTQFMPQDVRELPNYKKLHEVARDMDVAISVSGILANDEGRGGPPMVTINAMKTYYQGADAMYPDLPPKKVPFDKKSSQGFDL